MVKKKSSAARKRGRGAESNSKLERIVRFAVHPAIGIARVGNALEEYFLAPEAPGLMPNPNGPAPGRKKRWREGYKDPEGRLKRQACRFRVYGLDGQGRVVQEITAEQARITWTVHLAARKAAWYQFNNAMDLGKYAKESLMRNAGTDRGLLAVTPDPVEIAGANRNANGQLERYRIEGKLFDHAATLGELRCDEAGRLVVLPGPGTAQSFVEHFNPITTFANNEGWFDDIADGPVRARVQLKGSREEHEAEAAFVATTPPNYGPGLLGVTTMYDVALDLFRRESVGGHPKLEAPPRPSFTRDIFPILDRIVQAQWVSSGFLMLFGEGAGGELTTSERLRRLSSLGSSPKQRKANAHARQAVLHWFRNPAANNAAAAKIPPYYGDAFGDFSKLPNDELSVTATQYEQLSLWAQGDFDQDWRGRPKAVPLDKRPVPQQPHALDRAHLEDILGGPFHPGIELTWILRRASMWKEPFRLRLLPAGEQPKDDYGPILTPDVCLGADGPLSASGPGSLTRWMGTPWQTDSASCLAGYDTSYYLPLPSFWAPRMPNEVLSRFGYERASDLRSSEALRQRHFSYRSDWLRDLQPAGNARRQDMVSNWWQLGIVAPMERPKGFVGADTSAVWVETGRHAKHTTDDPTRRMVEHAELRIGPALDGAGSNRSATDLPKQPPPKGEDPRRVRIAARRRKYTRHDR